MYSWLISEACKNVKFAILGKNDAPNQYGFTISKNVSQYTNSFNLYNDCLKIAIIILHMEKLKPQETGWTHKLHVSSLK